MNYLRIIYLLLLIVVASIEASAQFPVIRNFGPQDYPGATQNWGLTESLGQYIFVANNSGLMVYGGSAWDMTTVPNNTAIHAVHTNNKGDRYYVGAFEELGYFENRAPLRCARYVSIAQLLPEKDRNFEWVWSIAEMPDGRVVFRCADRIIIYYPDREPYPLIKIYHIPGRISNMTLIDDTLYISSGNGIYMMRGDHPVLIKGSRALGRNHVVGAFRHTDGAIVFATNKKGFFSLDADGAKQIRIKGVSDILDGLQLYCLASAHDMLAFGTVADGVVVVEPTTGRIHHLDRSNGLRNNAVLSLLIDRDKNIWAALDNGLSYIVLDSPFRTLFTDAGNIGTGYASATFDDRLYLGTNQGLYHIPTPGTYTHRIFDPVTVNGVSGQIWSLGKYSGVLLCGADAGAFSVTRDNATRIEGLPPTWGFRTYPGRDDIIIASTYEGFWVLRKETDSFKIVNKIEGTREATTNFEIAPDGSIWYSHWLKGVYRLVPDSALTKIKSSTIYNAANQLPSDNDNLISKICGEIYVSASNGFHRLNPKSGKLEEVKWLTSLFNGKNNVVRVIETPYGDLWGYRPDHLILARKTSKPHVYQPRTLHYTSAVRHLQMNLGNISFLSESLTVMNQDEGFYIIDTETAEPSPREVWVDYVKLIGSFDREDEALIYRSRDQREGFSLPHDKSSLYFSFSISQYRGFAPIVFSTMIEGYDSDWTPYTNLDYREVINLPPGKYVMKVRARDSVTSGITEAEVPFRIRPAWYQTWWAITLMVILGALLSYFIIEFIRQCVARAIERRRIAEEQKRIEQDRHQQLIVQNASMSEANERLNIEIKKKSGELVDTDIRHRHKTDKLREIDESLKKILREADPEAPAYGLLRKLRRVVQTIKLHDVEEKNGPNIEDNINIVFDDLLSKLVKKYPKLTRNEIRLCSYLKLNMSTKEIATLMNLSERTVESNRYRLRKKFGMEAGQSFNEFFSSIL